MAVLAAIPMAFIPAFFFSWFLYWLDRYEKEPRWLLLMTFFWGGFFAIIGTLIVATIFEIGFSLVLNDAVLEDIAGGSITAPIVEEFMKGLAVLLVFLIFRKEFDSILDGMIYGGVTALGFAATENAFYIYDRGFSVSGWSGFWFLVFVRVVLVGWQHPFYTAFTGIGFAVSRLSRNLAAKYLAPLAGLAMAIIAHSFHNTLASLTRGWGGLALGALIDWGGWLFMFLFAVWMIRREGRLLPKHLQQEVAEGRITAAQLRTAASPFGASLASLGALGRGKFRATTRFYQVLGELAHKMEEVSILGDEGGYAAIIERLRGEMANLSPQVSA